MRHLDTMSRTRMTFGCGLMVWILFMGVVAPVCADIYRWHLGQVIPGTEAITLGPGINAVGWNTDSHHLRYGNFSGDLSNSNFNDSWLNKDNRGIQRR